MVDSLEPKMVGFVPSGYYRPGTHCVKNAELFCPFIKHCYFFWCHLSVLGFSVSQKKVSLMLLSCSPHEEYHLETYRQFIVQFISKA